MFGKAILKSYFGKGYFQMLFQGKYLQRPIRPGQGTLKTTKSSPYLQVAQARHCRTSATIEFNMGVRELCYHNIWLTRILLQEPFLVLTIQITRSYSCIGINHVWMHKHCSCIRSCISSCALWCHPYDQKNLTCLVPQSPFLACKSVFKPSFHLVDNSRLVFKFSNLAPV